MRGFSGAAGRYQRGRPDYPQELLAWLREAIVLGPRKTAVDLGAGTGKFTKLLISTGADVIAIDPVDAMLDELAAAVPGVKRAAGAAEAIPAIGASVDAVLCAQSFHWFSTAAALEEIHRVLRPTGKLGLVWNVRDERVDWIAAVNKIITPYEGDTPRFQTGDWRRAFDGKFFTDLVETRFSYRHVGTAQEVVVDRFMSVSFIACLPADERAEIAERLVSLTTTHSDLKGRDMIEVPYHTHAFHSSKK